MPISENVKLMPDIVECASSFLAKGRLIDFVEDLVSVWLEVVCCLDSMGICHYGS